MKKLVLVLAVLLVSLPAMAATVTINADCDVDTYTVSYATDGNNVRAFALDIQVDAGTITAVGDFSDDYDIYPGSIVIVDGEVNDAGSAVCDDSYPDTLGGIDTAGVTIEMGSLYADGDPMPGATGVLFSFTVSDSDAVVTITENGIRGGIVMEDPEEAVVYDPNVGTCDDGGVCNFDVSGPTYMVPDGLINVTDLNVLTGDLTYAKFLVDAYEVVDGDPTTGFLFKAAFDVSGPTYLVPDGKVNVTDLNILTGKLTYAKFLYDVYEYACGDPTLDPQ